MSCLTSPCLTFLICKWTNLSWYRKQIVFTSVWCCSIGVYGFPMGNCCWKMGILNYKRFFGMSPSRIIEITSMLMGVFSGADRSHSFLWIFKIQNSLKVNNDCLKISTKGQDSSDLCTISWITKHVEVEDVVLNLSRWMLEYIGILEQVSEQVRAKVCSHDNQRILPKRFRNTYPQGLLLGPHVN